VKESLTSAQGKLKQTQSELAATAGARDEAKMQVEALTQSLADKDAELAAAKAKPAAKKK
jgi:chromosome segregation ATPase